VELYFSSLILVMKMDVAKFECAISSNLHGIDLTKLKNIILKILARHFPKFNINLYIVPFCM
jgi:hypothetical protein